MMASVVEEIKSRLDLVDVISSYVSLEKSGQNLKANCPFHSEKTPSFVVFPHTQSWRCFGQCGTGGDVFSFMMKIEGWSFNETLQELGRRTGVEVKEFQAQHDPQDDEAEKRLETLLDSIAEAYHKALPNSPAAAYLQKRGIHYETAQTFKIGYAPKKWTGALDHLRNLGFSEDEIIEAGLAIRKDDSPVYDRFRNRLMIPIRDRKGKVIGFGARALSPNDNPKYLNSPMSDLFDKSKTLFGLDLARRAIRETETVVIVEGYLDVIQAHQAGYENVVATMGTALTSHHIQQLSRYAGRLILALDADAAGLKATMRGLEVAREALGEGDTYVLDARGMIQQAGHLSIDIRILTLPEGKDPDDFIRSRPQDWPHLVAQSRPLVPFLIDQATQDLDANTSVMERESIARGLLPLLTATENDLHRRNNMQLLALRLQIDERSLLSWAVGRTQQRKRQAFTFPPKKQRREFGPQPLSPILDVPSPALLASDRNRKKESYCLARLRNNPNLLHTVNRLLRSIGKTANGVLELPLEAEDFTQPDFQLIITLMQRATLQTQYSLEDYLKIHAEGALQDVLSELQLSALDLEVATTANQVAKQRLNEYEFQHKLVLGLRRERAMRMMAEIQSIQQQASYEGDMELHQTLGKQVDALWKFVKELDKVVTKKARL